MVAWVGVSALPMVDMALEAAALEFDAALELVSAALELAELDDELAAAALLLSEELDDDAAFDSALELELDDGPVTAMGDPSTTASPEMMI